MERRPRYSSPLFAAIAPLLLFSSAVGSSAQRSASTYDFYSRGPYRGEVPRPSAILGYEIGITHSTFRDQERVLLAIAGAAKDRVRLLEYGKSVEGRPLRLAIVSSPANIQKLEAIRSRISRLADPRGATPAQLEEIVRNTPTIVWINHCIHGDETASFESVIWVLYTLAASQSPDVLDALSRVVVVLNPVFNPDGHERFVTYYNSIAVGSPDFFSYEHGAPWAMAGRGNHYRFDMNRDKMIQSQPETRQESAAFFQWNPQVYADQHGQPEIYFFPPTSRSVNSNVDRARIEKWTSIFGRANATAFDKNGWTYVTRETFDFSAPFYLDTWSALSGAIGMTYETDGGGSLARRRSDGTISTLRDGAAHHFETAISTILTAARSREPLLRDYLAHRQNAISDGEKSRLRCVVIPAGVDRGRLAELASTLKRSGIEVREAKTAFRSARAHPYMPKRNNPPDVKADQKSAAPTPTEPPVEAVEFPAGSLIIDLAQPQGHLVRAYFEPDTEFEPEFIKDQLVRRDVNEKKNENERKEGYDFYDITAWALPYLFELPACWTEDLPFVDSRVIRPDRDGEVRLSPVASGVAGGKASAAYIFPYERDAAGQLAVDLLKEGYRLTFATKPVKAGGRDWPRGSIIIRIGRNPDSLHQRLDALAKQLGVEVTSLSSAYSEESQNGINSGSVDDIHPLQIAVVADDFVNITGYGSLWHLLNQIAHLEFTSIRLRQLQNADLSRFNVIIMPPGFGYVGVLGKTGMDKLKSWVGSGNVLIGLGTGGLWMTDKEAGFSTAAVVGADAPGEAKPVESKPPDGKPAEKKPKKPIDVPGAIFRATIDRTHFLGYGFDCDEIAVPLSGSTFLKPSAKGANVVKFGKSPLRISGFAWKDNTEELLADTAYVIDEPIGGGHAIIYLGDPSFRAMWPGLRRLILNAILFGPTRSPTVTVGSEQATK